MTKKDYVLIAQAIKKHTKLNRIHDFNFKQGYSCSAMNIACELSYAFQQENPQFSKEKFLSACGVLN